MKAFERAALAVVIVLVAWFYAWTVAPEPTPRLISADNRGYYNLLTRGFMKGQLSLDIEVDPFLATLRNPWDATQRGEHGLHDATYYHGKYYLYFGVTPVFVLFLPFRLLTGLFIDESQASLVFAIAGFLISAGLVAAIRRRYFPGAPGLALIACVLALGMADMMPALLRRTSFWEVPITCGYACFMASIAAIFRSVESDGRRRALWLGIASAAMGLAVGARPDYLFGCAAVLVTWLQAAGRAGGFRAALGRPDLRRLLLAAVVPLSVIGAGLALYNYLRFGNPVEFGLHYQMSGGDSTNIGSFAVPFLLYGFRLYWFLPAQWSPYFPFVTVAQLPPAPAGHMLVEDPYGILPNMPFVLLALGLVSFLGRRRPAGFEGMTVFCRSFIAGLVGTTILTMGFGAVAGRYMVDFLPGFMLLACIGWLGISTRPWFTGALRLAGTAAVAALLAYSALFNVLASLRHNELLRAEHPSVYLALSHRWNRISDWYDRWRRTKYGPIEMRVVFPPYRGERREPLIVTGRSFLADYLFVHYTGPDSIEFGLEHTSRRVLEGESVKVAPGIPHTVVIDMGSLYPPPGHPYFDTMPRYAARRLQSALNVTLDGKVVLHHPTEFYDATARTPLIGTAGDRPGYRQPFSGRIISWQRRPEATPTPASASGESGPIRLRLVFPAFTSKHGEPLVSSGETGRGDLVYAVCVDSGHLAFGYDHWGFGGPVSEPVAVDLAATHTMEIDYGALRPMDSEVGAHPPAIQGRLLLRLDGRTVLDQPQPAWGCRADTVEIGSNDIRASSAGPVFSGEILDCERPWPASAGPR